MTVNALVDELAKAAVEEHRVPGEVRREVGRKRDAVRTVAMGIGLAARWANEPQGDGRDAATFTTAREAGGIKVAGKGRGRQRVECSCRTVQLGGHNLVKAEGVWKCVVCGRSSKHWHRVAHELCAGNRALKWSQRARKLAGVGAGGGTDGAGHVRFLSDDMVWCDRCGATATHHAISLAQPCKGKPRPGGAEHNLRLLRRGINPITRLAFREGPFPEPGSNAKPQVAAESERWGGRGTVPEVSAQARGQGGRSASVKLPTAKQRLEALRKRVIEKERRLRGACAGVEDGGGGGAGAVGVAVGVGAVAVGAVGGAVCGGPEGVGREGLPRLRIRGKRAARSDGIWCEKCGGQHAGSRCPHFPGDRDRHVDAWCGYGTSRSVTGGEMNALSAVWTATEVTKMPMDGNCLFHALEHLKDGATGRDRAQELRGKVIGFMERCPWKVIGGASLEAWVWGESGLRMGEYVKKMRGGAWGGGSSWRCTWSLRSAG